MASNTVTIFDLFRGPKDQRAAAIERLITQNFPKYSNSRPSADPYFGQVHLNTDLTQTHPLCYGRIIEGVAYTHFYRVQVANGPVVPCRALVQTSLNVYGSRQLNTYAPGTGVLLYRQQQTSDYVIIGAIPDWGFDARQSLSDSIVQAGNSGLTSSALHQAAFTLNNHGGISDWSAGRPFDSITVSEWGAITETGLAVFLDSFLAYLRCDEETGLFLFYLDQLTRLAGHNLQLRSLSREREDLDDQNEFYNVEKFAVYLTEKLGKFNNAPYSDYRLYSAQEAQVNSPYYATVEPAYDDQQSFARLLEFHGYLGQGYKKVLTLPPFLVNNSNLHQPIPVLAINRYSSLYNYQGVAEENWSLTGQIALRSAKGIILCKSPLISVPKEVVRPEDPSGNTPTDYQFAGYYGAGPNHIVGDLGSSTPLVKTTAVFDLIAYLFNWQGVHPFYYHDLDWYLPNDSTMPFATIVKEGIPNFSLLVNQEFLPFPTPVQLRVDHRYNLVNYYTNQAHIALLDDGSLSLASGCGSEIKISNGQVYISAPGNIWLQPGKNVNIRSGWDTTITANNCVDISANWNDIRLKAENNIAALAGNNGCGGILLQSKGSGPSYVYNDGIKQTFTGIVLRADTSPIVAETNYFLVENPANQGLTDSDTWNNTTICFDAGQAGTITTHSKTLRRYLKQAAFDLFDNHSNEYWADHIQFDNSLNITGSLAVLECAFVYKDMLVGNSLHSTYVQYEHLLTRPENVQSLLLSQQQAMLSRKNNLEAFNNTSRADLAYLNNNSDLTKIEFTFRQESQYKTTDLQLYEGRWQQLYRLNVVSNGSIPGGNKYVNPNLQVVIPTLGGSDYAINYWVDNPVMSNSGSVLTSNHPGHIAWINNHYNLQNLTLYNPVTNLNVDRGSAYETAALAATTHVHLDNNYLIIDNPVSY